MNQEEQTAFLEAYERNVADASPEVARQFLRQYLAGYIDYSSDYASIMDALGIWHAAYLFALTRNKP